MSAVTKSWNCCCVLRGKLGQTMYGYKRIVWLQTQGVTETKSGAVWSCGHRCRRRSHHMRCNIELPVRSQASCKLVAQIE